MGSPSIRDLRAEMDRRSRRRGRGWRVLAWTGVAAVVVLGAALVWGPPLARKHFERWASEALGRETTLTALRFNPFTLTADLEGLRVADPAGGELLAWDRLRVNFEARSFVVGAWVLHTVELTRPRGRLVVEADGALNVSDLLASRTSEETGSAPRPVRIGRLAVAGGELEFVDHAAGAAPWSTRVGPVDFAIEGFHTDGRASSAGGFSASTEAGETFRWSGSLQVAPFRSAGAIEVGALQLAKYAPYLAPFWRGRIPAGELSWKCHYRIAPGGGGDPRVLQLDEGELAVTDLALHGPTGVELARGLALRASGVAVDAVAARATIAEVAMTDGQLAVTRKADGQLDWAELRGEAASAPAGAAVAPPAGAGWQVTVERTRVERIGWRVTDAAAGPRPAELAGRLERLTLGRLVWPELPGLPLELALGQADGGQLELTGDVQPAAGTARLAVRLGDWNLAPWSPYLEAQLTGRLDRGTLTMTGDLDLATGASGPVVRWTGAGRAADFVLLDGDVAGPSAGFGALELTGLQLVSQPLAVDVAELRLMAPQLRVARDAAGQWRVPGWRAAGASAVTDEVTVRVPGATPVPAPPLALVRLGRVQVTGGELVLLDAAVSPAASWAMRDLVLELGAVTSTQSTPADLKISAAFSGGGILAAQGRINPLALDRDRHELRLTLRGVDLKPASSYLGQYAGCRLERGALDLTLDYVVEGRRLRLGNVAVLEQFTLGERVASPQATKLPVALAVALLKDRAGRIRIDLPVEGDLDDPEFRVGRVVGRAIVNLLAKAATSPFALLGAALGGGAGSETADAELQRAVFAAGSATLDPVPRARIEQVARALVERPAVRLAVAGSYDPAEDAPAWQRAEVRRLAREAVTESRRRGTSGAVADGVMSWTEEDYTAGLRMLFAKTFPDELRELVASGVAPVSAPGVKPSGAATSGAPGTAAGADEAEASATRPGLPVRVWRALTTGGGGRRPPVTVAREPRSSAAARDAVQAPPEDAPPASAVGATGAETSPSPLDPTVLEARLAAEVPAGETELRALAAARAQAVQAVLLAAGVEAARVEVIAADAALTTGAQVELQLR